MYYRSNEEENRTPEEKKRTLSRTSDRAYRALEGSIWSSLRSNERSWNEKTAELYEKKRYIAIKLTMNILLFSSCIICTITEQPLNVQYSFYLAELALFLVSDPIKAMGRYLAIQSRALLAILCAMIIVALWSSERSYTIVVVMCTVIFFLSIKAMNMSWLAAAKWLSTDEVRKVRIIADPDNLALVKWQTDGKRKTRTLLDKLLGYEPNEETLDVLHRAVYLLGFLDGLVKNMRFNEIKDKLEEANEYIESLENDLSEVEEQLRVTLENLQDRNQELSELQAQYNNLQKRFKAEALRNEQMTGANMELLNELKKAEIASESKAVEVEVMSEKELRNERIHELRKIGLSLGRIADEVGCSKTTVRNVLTAQNVEEEDDGK